MSKVSQNRFGDLRLASLRCRDQLVIDRDCNVQFNTARITKLNVNELLYVEGNLMTRRLQGINGGEKLTLEGDIIATSNIFSEQDEYSGLINLACEFNPVTGNGNVAVTLLPDIINISPISGFDSTTVRILHAPCYGKLDSVDPITGNVAYDIGNVDTASFVDSYRYSIKDQCGIPHKVTQYVCLPGEIIPPTLNPGCVNGAFELQPSYELECDIPSLAVSGTGVLEPSTVTVTRVEVPSNNVGSVLSLISFTSWTVEQFPIQISPFIAPTTPANWTVSPGGYTATQLNNVSPGTILVGQDTDLCDWSVQFECLSNNGSDDDVFGFAIGFNSGDITNPDADYLLLDWIGSGGLGNSLSVGTYLRHVRGVLPRNSVVSTQGQGNYLTDEMPRLTQLGKGLTFGSSAWNTSVAYTFRFEYVEGQLQIFLNGQLEFDLPWFFPNGALVSPYSFSQASTIFRNGFKWTNVSCPCTSINVPENEWVSSMDITTAVDMNTGVLTITSPTIQQATRIGVTIENSAEAISNESFVYAGFLCQQYLTFIETVVISSRRSSLTFTTFNSDPNALYAFVITGLIQFTLPSLPQRRHDARFLTNSYPSGFVPAGGVSLNGTTAHWQISATVNRDHRYLAVLQGTGSRFSFRFNDSIYSDNSGNFFCDVYKICDSTSN